MNGKERRRQKHKREGREGIATNGEQKRNECLLANNERKMNEGLSCLRAF